MRQLVTLVFGLVLFCSCAVTPTEYSRPGFYAGASILGAASDLENIDKAGDIEDVDYTTGLGLRAGYRFVDYLAVEAAYQITDDWNDHDIALQTLALHGKWYILTGAVQPYVLGGFGALRADLDEIDEKRDGGFVRLGAGLEMYVLRFLPVFLELEYSKGTGATEEINYTDLQIGALFRF